MQAIGKIGLCIPEITDSLDLEMLDGMFTQAQALGYDLLLFTGVYNIHTNRGYNASHRGLDNIYALPAIADLDAVILAEHGSPVLQPQVAYLR